MSEQNNLTRRSDSSLSSSMDSLLSAVESEIQQTTRPHPPQHEETIYECNICYKSLTNNMVRTPCKHYYCSNCFFRWMRESQTCPNCRKLLVEDSHIETLIAERKQELISLNEDLESQYNIFRFFLDKNIKFKVLFFFLSILANLPSPPETSIIFFILILKILYMKYFVYL